METTIIVILLSSLYLAGCKSSSDSSKKITIRKNHGAKKEFALLSVRGDSAIVVLDWLESKESPLPLSHAELIRSDSIASILHEEYGSKESVTIGTLGGSIAGGLIASEFLPQPKKYSGADIFFPVHPFEDVVTDLLIILAGITVGAVLGGIVGNEFSNSNELFLYRTSDQSLLRSIALYPGNEPEIMKYIR